MSIAGRGALPPLQCLCKHFCFSGAVAKDGQAGLGDYLQNQYPRAPQQAEFLRAALQKGACMVLLDGLDEVGDVSDKLILGKTLRETVLKRVQRFAEQRCQPEHGNHIVVTSRLEGYHSGNLAGFAEAELGALRLPDEVEAFLQRWFPAYIHEHDPLLSLAAAAEQARRKRVEPLMASITRSDRAKLLAINPLLLTILAVRLRSRIFWRAVPRHRTPKDLPGLKPIAPCRGQKGDDHTAFQRFSPNLCESVKSVDVFSAKSVVSPCQGRAVTMRLPPKRRTSLTPPSV